MKNIMNINEIAFATFTKNLQFLHNYDSDLFQRVIFLSEMIENNEYSPRYELEYLESESLFDIYDINSKEYLYHKNPKKLTQDAVRNTNLNRINSFDLLQHHFYNCKEKYFFSEETPLYQKTDATVINQLFEYTKIFNSDTNNKNKRFKSIDKFVFIGTLLGQHISKISQKLNAEIYFICEENLEIFRLSLFVTDYSEITKKSQIIFSIMDDRHVFTNKFLSYLNTNINSNYMIKYYSSNYNIHDYFDRILEAIGQYSPLKFTYELMLNHVLKKSINNISQYPILNTQTNYNILENKAIIILAAGPSLGKNIEWLKNNKQNFFIIAIAATLVKLHEHGIKPNLIITVDAGDVVLKHFLDEIIPFINEIPVLAAHMTYNKVLEKLDKEYITIFEVMTAIKNSSKYLGGSSVGEISLQLSILLGGEEIYLLGTDLALDQKTGTSHSDGYVHSKEYDIKDTKLNSFLEQGEYSSKDTTMCVKGNFQDTVVTTTTFNKSIYNYNIFTNSLKNKNIKIYNLSDGAYIENTIPKKISDIQIMDKKDNIDIKKHLKLNSMIGFTDEESAHIKQSIEFINNVLKELEIVQRDKTKSYKQFMQQRENLFKLLLIDSQKYKNLFILDIFKNYITITEPYLYFNFNDANMKNESNIIKKVKKIWCSQLLNLSINYKEINYE